MPTSPMSHGEVKKVCDELECSPSGTSPGSALYAGSHDEPQAEHHKPKHAAGAKGKVTNAESSFGRKGTSLRRNIAAGKKADSNKDV